ncbi:MAG: hypothetical protein IKC71_03465 [Clostridia bacterium]|nr:hypothetical protein [Clostridia bacterium]
MATRNEKSKSVNLSFIDILDHAFNFKVKENLEVINPLSIEVERVEDKVVYNGTTFTIKDNQILFTFLSGESGSINIDSACGKVLKIAYYNSAIYIFCERVILRLIPAGNPLDFRLEKLDLLVENIVKDSILVVGDRIVFVSNNTLFELVKDRLYLVNTVYDGKLDFSLGVAKENGGYEYFFSSKVFNKNGVRLNYNPLTKTTCLLNDETPYFVSKPLTFNSDAVKNIEQISFYIDGEVLMVLSTDTTVKRYNLKPGEKVIKPYLKCRAFKVEFLLKSGKKIENLKVKYSKL